MNHIKTIIVDDEEEAREGLKLLLHKDSEIQILQVCKNGLEAIKQINILQPDLVFLDIQMPEITGFDVLNNLNLHPLPAVIFVTAYDQYALKAFEIHAIDYLLKPFTDERFFQSLNHVKYYIQHTNWQQLSEKIGILLQDYQNQKEPAEKDLLIDEGGNADCLDERLVIKSFGKIHFVPLKDVIRLEASDYYVKIHLENKTYLVRESLKNFEKKLPKNIFFRLHKSNIVNINYITEMEPYFNGEFIVKLRNGQKLKMSRNYRQNFSGII